MPKPATLDHLVSKKKPVYKKHFVVLDADMAQEYRDIEKELEEAKARHGFDKNPETASALQAAQKRLDDITDALEAEDAVVYMKLKAVSRRVYDSLVEKHPPTEEQVAEATKLGGSSPEWNADTFPAALVAAAVVEPKLTVEEVNEIWNSDLWSSAECQSLFLAAFMLSVSPPNADLGKGFGGTRHSADRPATPSTTESPIQFSSEELLDAVNQPG